MAWYLNNALTTMRAEVDDRFPNRDRGSDGTIGDEAHQGTGSDHNPDRDGSVDAWDMDVNLRSGNDPAAIEWLKSRFQAHPSSRYWIHNRQIASRDIADWQRRRYDGPNPHDKHVHWNTRESGEDSTAAWGIKEDDVTPEDLLNAEIHNPVTGKPAKIRDFITSTNTNAYLARNSAAAADAKLVAVATALGQVDEAVAEQLVDEFARIEAGVDNVDEAVVERIGDPSLDPAVTAELLRAALGERAEAVGRALAGL